ncbi:hypothetical protein AAFF_G00302790 [Aldrovandia affinis]|uniref:Cadherin domain-containing protein n=1 Tax=Aldrovandia affinis TaxID=143900 RepID=A0AAD7W0V1_9TELE|nr:hypothetical protein AAFF_G00302790 [Aldrovandia affinis]
MPGARFQLEGARDPDFQVVAKDSGTPSLSSNVTVNVFILDQNDNAPVILSPVSANGSAEGVEEIPRNVNAGHSVTKVRAYDADIGYNAWLSFSLQHATDSSLFGLERYSGHIRTLRSFTETDEAEHKLVIVVKDNGNVSLSATATVIINAVEPKEAFAASDTKSAVQTEEEDNVTFYLIITLGSVSALFLLSIIGLIVMQCSKPPDNSSKYSRDPNYADTSGSGTLCHSIQYRSGDKRYMLVGPRMSIGSAIVPGSNGNTLVVPDHRRRISGEEELQIGTLVGNIAKDLGIDRGTIADRNLRIVTGTKQDLFQFQVVAKDSGTPSLSSNVTVNVFILDQNDNAPVILSPVSANGSAEGVEEIPRNVNAGHSVTKVRAYDADIGYNAWLSFSLQHATDSSLFSLERYSGHIRTLRSFTETDEAEHKLVIVVKDNGNVSLSATATVIINAVEPKEAFAASDTKSAVQTEEEDNVTFYLIITLGSVSALFLLSIIGLIVMQCSKPPDNSSKYSRDSNYADTSGSGTLCHSIQYRSGDKRLSQNENFELKVEDLGENNKIPVLVLLKPLDRERVSVYELILTAFDGGNPVRTDVLNISIIVLDTNDNAPVFDKQKYSVTLSENVAIGTFVIQVNATDLDSGDNGAVEYAFGEPSRGRLSELFDLDRETGEIRVKGPIDFEEKRSHEINVRAMDKGHVPLAAHCNVFVRVEDVNDNKPDIEITSLLGHIPENAELGTVVALVGVTDLDSGPNGQVICTLPENVPFELKATSQTNFYSLVTNGYLDREQVSDYVIEITARDLGTPALSSFESIRVEVSDVNDNKPAFPQNPYTLYLLENGAPGACIMSVTAHDSDLNENAQVSYMLGRDFVDTNITPFLNINSENGNIYALKNFDFETMKTFKFQVVAKDSGTPSLSSNVTVNVFILDQNDNAPVILSPVSANGSAEGVEEIPRNVNAGHSVTKVRAYDADVGYNAWLSFSLQHATDSSLFGLERYSGQIRTLRSFTETDEAEHKLVIVVKDNGNVSLSATATVIINAVEPKEAFAASDTKSAVQTEEEDNVTFYLIITLGSVSALFLLSIIGLIVMQCSKPPDNSSKYSRDPITQTRPGAEHCATASSTDPETNGTC